MKYGLNKGITLISLVITIVIMLILAGVTINLVIGNNGILSKVNQSKTEQLRANAKEDIENTLNTIEIERVNNNQENITIDNLTEEELKNNNDKIIEYDPSTNTGKYEDGKVIDFTISSDLKALVGDISEKENSNFITITKNNDIGFLNVTFNPVDTNRTISKVKVTLNDGKVYNVNGNTLNIDGLNRNQTYTGTVVATDSENNEFETKNIIITSKADTTSAYNILDLNTDKLVFINDNGSDETGNGTQANPYKTINKFIENSVAGNSYEVLLGNGTYDFDIDIVLATTANKTIHFVGNKKDTTLKIKPSVTYFRESTATFEFYDLCWWSYDINFKNNYIVPSATMNYHNVLFKTVTGYATRNDGIMVPGVLMKFENCSFNEECSLRNDLGTITLINCYGNYAPGYASNLSDVTTSIKTSNPQLSEDYKIIEDNSVWKDKGTGTDLDGTQADIGVYGSKYSWDNATIKYDIK